MLCNTVVKLFSTLQSVSANLIEMCPSKASIMCLSKYCQICRIKSSQTCHSK